HAAIAKVVGGQAPGRKLLAAAAEHLAVDADWLLTGRGQPFAAPTRGVPVALAPLPGHPLLHQELAACWVDVAARAPRPTQYWLGLSAEQPVLRDPARGFLERDELLMEADPGRFPEERWLGGCLCVARRAGPPPALKLGALTYYPAEEGEGD